MKIVYQGDLHLRDKAPVNRIDDYQTAQFDKLNQLVEFANDSDAVLMLGGDLFDTHKVSHEVANRASDILSKVTRHIYCALGQHDVPFHQMDLKKSPVYPLWTSDIIGFAGVGPTNSIGVTFADWEQEVEEPVEGKFNILLGHISVFHKVPFYWKGEGYNPKTLKVKYPGFDLYLCGDIHSPCVEGNVVVSGSMMRQSIDQLNYRPRCYLIDTETMKIEPLYYEIKSDVFNVESKSEASEDVLELDHLVEALKQGSAVRDSYKRDCLTLSKEDEPVKKIIEGVFDELN